jgi:hypothetical protein
VRTTVPPPLTCRLADRAAEQLGGAHRCAALLALDEERRRKSCVARRAATADIRVALRTGGRNVGLEVVEVAHGEAAHEAERDPVAERLPALLLNPVALRTTRRRGRARGWFLGAHVATVRPAGLRVPSCPAQSRCISVTPMTRDHCNDSGRGHAHPHCGPLVQIEDRGSRGSGPLETGSASLRATMQRASPATTPRPVRHTPT